MSGTDLKTVEPFGGWAWWIEGVHWELAFESLHTRSSGPLVSLFFLTLAVWIDIEPL